MNLNASQVVLAAEAVSGIQANAAGTVFDNSSERVTSGKAEGFRVYVPDGTKKVFVDAWEEQALTNPSTSPEDDQASVVMLTESHDDTGQTLTVPLSWPVEEGRPYVVNAATADDGYGSRWLRYPTSRRFWVVQANAATTTERNTLRTFWADHKGTEKAFSWVTPAGETVKVHFADDALATALIGPGVHRFAFTLEELLT